MASGGFGRLRRNAAVGSMFSCVGSMFSCVGSMFSCVNTAVGSMFSCVNLILCFQPAVNNLTTLCLVVKQSLAIYIKLPFSSTCLIVNVFFHMRFFTNLRFFVLLQTCFLNSRSRSTIVNLSEQFSNRQLKNARSAQKIEIVLSLFSTHFVGIWKML